MRHTNHGKSSFLRHLFTSGAVVAAFLLSQAMAGAHHSPNAMYDVSKQLSLTGKIVKVLWVNPHSIFVVEATQPNGTKVVWEVETSTPNALFRRGVTRDALPPGTPVKLTVRPARDGSNRAIASSINFGGKSSELELQ